MLKKQNHKRIEQMPKDIIRTTEECSFSQHDQTIACTRATEDIQEKKKRETTPKNCRKESREKKNYIVYSYQKPADAQQRTNKTTD
jgi:hypothetical protein